MRQIGRVVHEEEDNRVTVSNYNLLGARVIGQHTMDREGCFRVHWKCVYPETIIITHCGICSVPPFALLRGLCNYCGWILDDVISRKDEDDDWPRKQTIILV